jgi:hypothetical protein
MREFSASNCRAIRPDLPVSETTAAPRRCGPGVRKASDWCAQNARRMDLAGLHSLLLQPVVVSVAPGTKFIGRLELIPNSTSAVGYAINRGPALEVGSIVFVQRLPA